MRFLGLLLCVSLSCLGEELSSALSADRSVQATAASALERQRLQQWTMQLRRKVEQDWGRRLEFEARDPFRVILLEEAGERQGFFQRLELGRFQQQLWVGKEDASWAEALEAGIMRAHLNRLLSQQPPRASREAPAWLLEASLVEAADWGEGQRWPAYPEILGDPNLEASVESWWLLHFVKDQGKTQLLLDRFRSSDPFRLGDWADLAGASDLRELHQRWDLWVAATGDAWMAEFRLEFEAELRLQELLWIYPALYGVADPEFRRRRMLPSDLEDHVEETWLIPLLQRWMLDLQRLRFRQPADLSLAVEAWLQWGGQLVEAAQDGKLSRKEKRQLRELNPQNLQSREP